MVFFNFLSLGRSGLVGGGWLVGRSWGWLVGWSRCGVVWLGLVFGILGLTLIFHISNISILISGVSHNLDTAIRKVHTVGTAGGISVTGLRVGKVSTGVVILDSILIGVLGRDISVSWLMVGGSRLVGRSGLVCRGWSICRCRGWRGRLVSKGNSGKG